MPKFKAEKLEDEIEKERSYLISLFNTIDPRHSTYATSYNEPFQRWFPYLEGYSSEFVSHILDHYAPDAKIIFDPFGGNGTTALVGASRGIKSYICEINPLMSFMFDVKVKILSLSMDDRLSLANRLRNAIKEITLDCIEDEELKANYVECFSRSKFFNEENYSKILRLKTYENKLMQTDPVTGQLFSICVVASLIPSSLMKRAGDLRFKNQKELKKEIPDILKLILEKSEDIIKDICNFRYKLEESAELLCENAKDIVTDGIIFDAVITSPPYPNGTNYFRNTKIELWYLKMIKRKSDLGELRFKAVTAGINDVTKSKNMKQQITSVGTIVGLLKEKEYDSRISAMISMYFHEIGMILEKIIPKTSSNCKIIIDIGDSQYAGVHIKVDEIYCDILHAQGFELLERVVLRKRKSKDGSPLSQFLLIFARVTV